MTEATHSACAIAVVSGKGGTGKSTFSCGLGRALAKRGKSVLVIDADAGLRCLDIMLGVSEQLLFDLGDVLCGRCDLDGAVIEVTGGLHLLAAPLQGGIDAAALGDLVEGCRSQYDFVIIDSTAGVDSGFEAARAAADRALIVTSPDAVSVRDAGRVSALLEGATPHRLVINRYTGGTVGELDGVIDGACSQLIGIVPFDMRLQRGKSHRRTRRAFARIADRLCGREVRLPKLKKIKI